MKIHSNVDEALDFIESGQKIFVHGATATPHSLIKGLVDVLPHYKDIEIMHLHTHGNAEYATEKFKDNCRVTNLFWVEIFENILIMTVLITFLVSCLRFQSY